MLINFRNALMAGKRWKNPYVTDGLVAMWDGEWNAGGGKHDASATTWLPLVQPSDATAPTVSSSGQFTWGSNYLQINKKYQYFTSPSLHALFAQSEQFSVENVTGHDPDNPNRGFDVITDSNITYGYTNTPTFKARLEESADVRNRFFIRGAISNPTGYLNANAHSFSCAFSTPTAEVYRDAGYLFSFNAGTSPLEQSYITIGGIYTDLRAYCIRIYSRALTAAEIAHNYNIDKARFGLP